jgi:D-alanyl-lipoteichoic acid acyltransferase DltB (MBOAT superfamily)
MAVFFPLVFLGCILLRRFGSAKAAQAWILVASLVFYSWFKLSNLPYLLVSILVNWTLASAVGRAPQPGRKRLLRLGLALNIGSLCAFKYVNFFLSNFTFILPRGFHLPELDFPLGISFFTLTQIMYLVDVYEEILPPMGLFDYSSFVSFFPYVISGPIPKAKRIQHQFPDFGGKPGAAGNQQGMLGELAARGLFLFTIGLFKKVLLADAFAKLADRGFNPAVHLSALEAWCFATAYMMQIYFDFSGYSDMAIGCALMLGIEIPRNFDRPFRSKSIIEFWTRWHISLSQFITTYLYTPTLTSMWRISLFTSALATFLAMTIAGLWHGPAWTFVLYGVIHGLALACNQYWRKKKVAKLPAFPSWFLTFFIVIYAEIFFRSVTLPAGFRMAGAMFDPRHGLAVATLAPAVQSLTAVNLAMVPVGLLIAFVGKSSDELSREFKPTLINALTTGAVFVASCLFMAFNTSQSFLYFQF